MMTLPYLYSDLYINRGVVNESDCSGGDVTTERSAGLWPNGLPNWDLSLNRLLDGRRLG